jgi:transcriptional regulator with XRE-family HTH domain
MTPIELKQWQADLGLSDVAMAAYLGVPVPTLTKWLNGTRTPDSATLRLFGILQRIGRTYPVLHGELMQEARAAAPDVPRRPRGRSVGTKVSPSPENAPQGPLEAQTTVSEIPAWLAAAV